jgi:hypothetical protein
VRLEAGLNERRETQRHERISTTVGGRVRILRRWRCRSFRLGCSIQDGPGWAPVRQPRLASERVEQAEEDRQIRPPGLRR